MSASVFPVRGGPGVGFHVYMYVWLSIQKNMYSFSWFVRACVCACVLTGRLFCAVCVFISSFHKYASAHVFGQDKKRAERLKGKWVTGGRETQRDER